MSISEFNVPTDLHTDPVTQRGKEEAHASNTIEVAGDRRIRARTWLCSASQDSDLYEIAIGGWKATIVRQVVPGAALASYRARFETVEKKSWVRRRKLRMVERLNTRRRSAD